LKIDIETDSLGIPKKGTYKFETAKCGGDLSFLERNLETGAITLQQSLRYGKCKPNCRIILDRHLKTYKEQCDGDITGGGALTNESVFRDEPTVYPYTTREIAEYCVLRGAFGLESRQASCSNTIVMRNQSRIVVCRKGPADESMTQCMHGGQDFAKSLSTFRQFHTLRLALTNEELALFIQQNGETDQNGYVRAARQRLAESCSSNERCIEESLRAARVSILRQKIYISGSETDLSCIDSLPRPPEASEANFYGSCKGTAPNSGILVWSTNGTPFDLRCISDGTLQDQNAPNGFVTCEPFWKYVPGYCSNGEYKGQCENGVANGVGVKHDVTYSRLEVSGALGMFAGMARPQEAHEIARGMFKNGKLDGFGNYFSISGCGMAGCSGNRTNQTGWFETGQLRFECATVQTCAAKVSGAAFTTRLKPREDAATALARARITTASSFDEAIGRFERSGHIDDLKAARTLARTPVQQAVLEFNILRTAGYEKGLVVTAKLIQGDRSMTIEDSQRLLGFYRSVDSGLPLRLQWQIAPNPGVAPLRLGSYRVKLRIGVVIKSTTRSCMGNACSNRDDVQTLAQSVETVLTPVKAYRAAGEVILMAPGAGTSVLLGVASVKDVNSTEPLLAIESVELAQ